MKIVCIFKFGQMQHFYRCFYDKIGLPGQKEGIDMVRQNIANFDGDPDNITIYGQSGGDLRKKKRVAR
jgi:carboxylesterase type B